MLVDKLTELKAKMRSTGQYFDRMRHGQFFVSGLGNIDKAIKLASPPKESLFTRLAQKFRRS